MTDTVMRRLEPVVQRVEGMTDDELSALVLISTQY